MKILYSYNKTGFEAAVWDRELRIAHPDLEIIPFNHGSFVPPSRYLRAQQLDNLYYAEDSGLLRMYAEMKDALRRHRADVLLVDNCQPYHPDFLRSVAEYKVLRTTDGPTAAYDRDFAYLHAYDHVLYHSPAHSRELSMAEKLDYCGSTRHDFWPLGLFDAFCRPNDSHEQIFGSSRDLDIVFVGALHVDKMPLLATLRRAFGRRFHIYGLAGWKRNVYFNAKYRAFTWVKPIDFSEYVPLYRRAKIGVNAHLRGKYTVGGYRMFELAGNGAAQVSDGGEYLEYFFQPGREIEGYETHDQAVEKIDTLLRRPNDRIELARNGHHRAMTQHRMTTRLASLYDILDAPVRGVDRRSQLCAA